jgi:prepilin-type processing-associated H-X9-DG protein
MTPQDYNYPGYCGSEQFFSGVDTTNQHAGSRLVTSVKDPEQKIMMIEEAGAFGMIYQIPATLIWEAQSPGSMNYPGVLSAEPNPLDLRHQGRSNYLFADGHVKAYTLRQTLTPTVLWDNTKDWCDECYTQGTSWYPRDIPKALQTLDKFPML